MAKRVFRFPIGTLVFGASMCVDSSVGGQSRSGLRSNLHLTAQLHWASRDSTTTLSYSLFPVLETWRLTGDSFQNCFCISYQPRSPDQPLPRRWLSGFRQG